MTRWVSSDGWCKEFARKQRLWPSRRMSLGHDPFYFVGGAGKTGGKELVSVLGNQHVVLDAHAQIFLGNVNPRLHGDNHARLERAVAIAGIVNVEAKVMAYAVRIISSQCASFFIVAVGIDVVGNDLLQAALATVERRAGLHRGQRGVLRP